MNFDFKLASTLKLLPAKMSSGVFTNRSILTGSSLRTKAAFTFNGLLKAGKVKFTLISLVVTACPDLSSLKNTSPCSIRTSPKRTSLTGSELELFFEVLSDGTAPAVALNSQLGYPSLLISRNKAGLCIISLSTATLPSKSGKSRTVPVI